MTILEAIIKYLDEKTNYEVFSEIPEDAPEAFFIIDKTGSSFFNYVSTDTIIIQSYGRTKLEASEMNDYIKKIMLEYPVDNRISSVNLNSDYSFPDLAEKRPRFQAVFDVTNYYFS